jgi:hypothetical protein
MTAACDNITNPATASHSAGDRKAAFAKAILKLAIEICQWMN